MAKTSNKTKSVFNPIKETVDGKKAMNMVWTTQILEKAVKGINEGKRLIANPFYENNTNRLKADMVFEKTEEEIREWLRCKDDIIYFANTYCKLMTPEGIQHITLREYQEEYLRHLMQHNMSIFLSCRQSGKCNLFINRILVKINNEFWNLSDHKLKKQWDFTYYIKDEDAYFVPFYELYNIFCKKTIRWKIEYQLYKILDKLLWHTEQSNETKITSVLSTGLKRILTKLWKNAKNCVKKPLQRNKKITNTR